MIRKTLNRIFYCFGLLFFRFTKETIRIGGETWLICDDGEAGNHILLALRRREKDKLIEFHVSDFDIPIVVHNGIATNKKGETINNVSHSDGIELDDLLNKVHGYANYVLFR